MRFMMETFLFFEITDANTFKRKLGKDIHPRITTATQLVDPTAQPTLPSTLPSLRRVSEPIRINDDLGDAHFSNGQANEAASLGDPGTIKWRRPYRKGVHGLLQVASKDMNKLNAEVGRIKSLFAEAHSREVLTGSTLSARPGAGVGHERE
ncbi:dye-decolorizing heme-containing peroxidase [Marasmius tenuissimus]|uniref:Dye-decolorizing heme-containing peroxidase n=1 Tax=Marasmius tenuissimus TaxID=585030 RepID=A0ABR2ZPB3_9AGAR